MSARILCPQPLSGLTRAFLNVRRGRRHFAFALALHAVLLPLAAHSQSQQALNDEFTQAMHPDTVRLWPERAPGALGDAPQDIPTLSIFRPAIRPNGTAVIVVPGGSYMRWVANHEGRQFADWYAARGITAFVLKYRLGPKYPLPTPLIDAQRAIRLVRARAAEFDLDPHRVGMMGFSAGGHLTATTGTAADSATPDAPDPIDRLSSRPDFMVLAYPALLMLRYNHPSEIAYCDLMKMKNCDRAYLERFSPELHVNAQTPPTFLFHTSDDGLVPATDSVIFYSALLKAGVPAELHIFGHGHHGVGLAGEDPALGAWPALLDGWMRARGLFAENPNPKPAS
jgi:acetyl esterase/lipase